jgi:hypothetical protein
VDGFLPLTKSFLGDLASCPFHAWMKKAKRVKGEQTPGARRGTKVHDQREAILRGQKTLEEALVEVYEDPIESDRDVVAWLLEASIMSDPVTLSKTEANTLEMEKSILIDRSGRQVKERKEAVISMRLDRMFLRDNGAVRVDDLKNAWVYEDGLNERMIYALGARVCYPKATAVEFGQLWTRFTKYPLWRFEWASPNSVTIKHPDGRLEQYEQASGDPLLHYALDLITEVQAMDPIPRPGSHCSSWYGEPCQFIGKECPLSENVPALINETVDKAPVPNEIAPGELLRGIVTGEVPLTPELASWAFVGMTQFKGFVKQLKKALAEWSLIHGPITLGEQQFGWFTKEKRVVDKAFVLREMLDNGMTDEDIARVVSISKSGIKRIGKRKYGSLQETLLEMGIEIREGDRTFGLLNDVEEED